MATPSIAAYMPPSSTLPAAAAPSGGPLPPLALRVEPAILTTLPVAYVPSALVILKIKSKNPPVTCRLGLNAYAFGKRFHELSGGNGWAFQALSQPGPPSAAEWSAP